MGVLQETHHDKPQIGVQVIKHPDRQAVAELGVWTNALLATAEQFVEEGSTEASEAALGKAISKVNEAFQALVLAVREKG